MRCVSCGSESPPEEKSCGDCGALLTNRCQSCGALSVGLLEDVQSLLKTTFG